MGILTQRRNHVIKPTTTPGKPREAKLRKQKGKCRPRFLRKSLLRKDSEGLSSKRRKSGKNSNKVGLSKKTSRWLRRQKIRAG